jgi:hypothetical protein
MVLGNGLLCKFVEEESLYCIVVVGIVSGRLTEIRSGWVISVLAFRVDLNG